MRVRPVAAEGAISHSVCRSQQRFRRGVADGSFARSFTLPTDVDESKILAESKDGVLTVRLPKTEARKPRAIEVQVR